MLCNFFKFRGLFAGSLLFLAASFSLAARAQVEQPDKTQERAWSNFANGDRVGTGGGDIRPVPDPTALTTQQLLREIFSLRELLETRLTADEKAVSLLQSSADKVPSIAVVAEDVAHLKELREADQRLNGVKFDSIEKQFGEEDKRSEQGSNDSKVAIAAALQAQKEAVNAQNESNDKAIEKSGNAFSKQIDQLGALLDSKGRGFDDKIADLKDRVTTVESVKKGSDNTWAYVLAIIGAVVGIGGIVIVVVRRPPPPWA